MKISASENQKPYLLMVPPWLGNNLSFNPLIKILNLSYECIVVELPGFGFKPEIKGAKHSILEYEKVLDEEISKLSADRKLYVLGCSMGCSIIATYLHKNRNGGMRKIASCVFLSPLLHEIKLDQKSKFMINFLLLKTPLPNLIKNACKYRVFRRLLFFMGDNNLKSIDWNVADKYALGFIPKVSTNAIIESTLSAIKFKWPEGLFINIPTKVIYGRADSLYKDNPPESYASKFVNDFSIDAYAGGYHFLLLQKAETTAFDIRNFLEKY